MPGQEFGVLVGVGPKGVHDGVVDLAVAEARRRGTGVELVHVVHSLAGAPGGFDQVQLVDREVSRVGRELLTRTAELVRERAGGALPIGTQLLDGPIVSTLVGRAAEADLVVLERLESGLERLLTMSVSSRVAAHAPTPVVVVPRGWTPADPAGPVTVGVDDPREAFGQVAPALEYAELAGLPLVALHALWLAEPYQGVVFADGGREQWVTHARAGLEDSLGELSLRARVELTDDVRWARPVDALVEATRRSSVLVLGRRPGEHPWGGTLGAITRTVLRHAECPVLLVDRT